MWFCAVYVYVYVNGTSLPVYYPYYVLTHEDYSRRLKTAFYGRWKPNKTSRVPCLYSGALILRIPGAMRQCRNSLQSLYLQFNSIGVRVRKRIKGKVWRCLNCFKEWNYLSSTVHTFVIFLHVWALFKGM